MATDPVCGMQVDERAAKNSTVFDGKTYFFCSAGCKGKFEANPSSFLNKPAASGAGHASATLVIAGLACVWMMLRPRAIAAT